MFHLHRDCTIMPSPFHLCYLERACCQYCGANILTGHAIYNSINTSINHKNTLDRNQLYHYYLGSYWIYFFWMQRFVVSCNFWLIWFLSLFFRILLCNVSSVFTSFCKPCLLFNLGFSPCSTIAFVCAPGRQSDVEYRSHLTSPITGLAEVLVRVVEYF